MDVRTAVENAKAIGSWNVLSHRATSVLVRFMRKDQMGDEIPDHTELDLYEDDKETELCALWDLTYRAASVGKTGDPV